MDEKGIKSIIEESLNEACLLHAAATACATNFNWLSIRRERGQNELRPIYLLDFDSIASSVQTLATLRLVHNRPTQGSEATGSTFALHDFMGPYTMALVSKSLGEFSLPLGAKKELLEWKQRILATERGTTIKRLFAEAQLSSNPLENLISNRLTDLGTILRSELEQLVGARDDILLLEHFLTNEVSIDTLVGESSTGEDRDVLAFAYDCLQQKRPGLTSNNFSDALNLLLLIRITKRFIEQRRPRVPVMISQTAEVSNIGMRAQGRWLFETLNLLQFNHPYYLIIATQLEAIGEGDEEFVIRESELLARDTRALMDSYMQTSKAMRLGKIRADDFSSPEWQLVQVRKSQFQRRMDQVLPGVSDALSFDRIGHQNVLSSHRLQSILAGVGASDHKILMKSIQDLRSLLIEAVELDSTLRTVIFHRPELARQVADDIGWLFKFSCTSSEELVGLPLGQVPRARTSSGLDSVTVPQETSVRILVHDTVGLCKGATFAIDVWRKSAQRPEVCLSVVWRHYCEAVTILSRGIDFLHAHSVGIGSPKTYQCRMYSTNPVSESVHEFAIPTRVPQEVRSDVDSMDYTELSSSDLVFFADVKPVYGIELQAGLVFALREADIPFTSRLAEVIHQTLEVKIPAIHLSKALQNVFRVLKPQEYES